jgi:hypothetical protein
MYIISPLSDFFSLFPVRCFVRIETEELWRRNKDKRLVDFFNQSAIRNSHQFAFIQRFFGGLPVQLFLSSKIEATLHWDFLVFEERIALKRLGLSV